MVGSGAAVRLQFGTAYRGVQAGRRAPLAPSHNVLTPTCETVAGGTKQAPARKTALETDRAQHLDACCYPSLQGAIRRATRATSPARVGAGMNITKTSQKKNSRNMTELDERGHNDRHMMNIQ